jgi:hypothetical protein
MVEKSVLSPASDSLRIHKNKRNTSHKPTSIAKRPCSKKQKDGASKLYFIQSGYLRTLFVDKLAQCDNITGRKNSQDPPGVSS